jgi:serine/threonine protein phosphatase PrpC
VNASLIAETLADKGNLESKGQRLIEAAKKAGGPDNVTAVLLRCYQN